MDGIDHGTSIIEIESFSNSKRASEPAGIDQPDVGLIFFNFLDKESSIFPWVADKECGTKARGESGLRFINSDFSSSDFSGIT